MIGETTDEVEKPSYNIKPKNKKKGLEYYELEDKDFLLIQAINKLTIAINNGR